jgi:hypothetical protein
MKNYIWILPVVIIALIIPITTRPAVTAGTQLVMGAHWDDGTYVNGTVILGKVTAWGPDTVAANKALSNGWTTIATPLAPNSLYDVTLVSSSGTQLVKFPFTTALIDPTNLQRAEIDLVFHKTQNTLASAQIKVSMGF